MKHRLVKALFGGTLAFGLAGCAGAPHGQTVYLGEPNGIVVTAVGESEAPPDRAHFVVGVEVQRPSVAEAREAGAQAQTAVLDALHSAGIAEEHIRTTQLTVQPQYNYTETEGRQLIGYTLRNTVEVRVDDLDELSAIVDGAVSAGGDAVQLQGIRFELSDDAEARSTARTRAVEKARTNAEEIARASGVTLGAPLAIEESSGGSGGGPMPMMVRAQAESDTASPVERGLTHIEIQVRVRYAIE